MGIIKLVDTANQRRLHIGSFFTDLNEQEYQELKKIFCNNENVPKEKLTRRSLSLTNQKLWQMAKTITDKQKTANEKLMDSFDWDMLQDDWFDWLQDELFGSEA